MVKILYYKHHCYNNYLQVHYLALPVSVGNGVEEIRIDSLSGPYLPNKLILRTVLHQQE